MKKFEQVGVRRALVGASLVGASVPAFAAGIDVSSITSAITDAATAGATVGAAVVVMLVGIKVFKWLRRAL